MVAGKTTPSAPGQALEAIGDDDQDVVHAARHHAIDQLGLIRQKFCALPNSAVIIAKLKSINLPIPKA